MTYLMETLESLVNTTSDEQKQDIVVVVLVGSLDQTYNKQVVKTISHKFDLHVESGFIQVVQAHSRSYPDFSSLKLNFGDAPDRVKWRSKQALDFAYMFSYGKNISKYYVQIEDDVLCAKNFLESIKDFVTDLEDTQTMWSVVDLSLLGFIGKLMPSYSLDTFSKYLLLFFSEIPVDFLLSSFRSSAGQFDRIIRQPSLFQHQGKISSFDTSQVNPLEESDFADDLHAWSSDDPQGFVVSSMPHVPGYPAKHFYSKKNVYFWSRQVHLGDSITLVLSRPHAIGRIIVETGFQDGRDKLNKAKVEISHKYIARVKTKPQVACASFRQLGYLVDGRLDVTNITRSLGGVHVQCLRVTALEKSEAWILFKQFALFKKLK